MAGKNRGLSINRTDRHLPTSNELDALRQLFTHHIDSFDYMVDKGFQTLCDSIDKVVVCLPSKKKITISLSSLALYNPKSSVKSLFLYRERKMKNISYTGSLQGIVLCQLDDRDLCKRRFNFGQFPIMVKSNRCHLRRADPKTLVKAGEESSEMGGYFILNGLERVVRPLLLPKRNYPMSIVQKSFSDRREGCTDKAVVIRCERKNQCSVTVRLYYLCNGSARLGFWIQRREYLLPVGIVLKALIDINDDQILETLTCCCSEREMGAAARQLVFVRAKFILAEVGDLSLLTRTHCLKHIGEHFKVVMDGMENESETVVANAVLQKYIFVHLDKNIQKFNLLIFMLQKLFSLVDGMSVPDDQNSLQNQEVLLPGHLITIYLKEKLEVWMRTTKKVLQDEINKSKIFGVNNLGENVKKVLGKIPAHQISSAVVYMLKTGSVGTQKSLDLNETTGFTVKVERGNFLRFISHFRAVHRGPSFTGLRTTTVRKLLPESWGFLCPVHSPDGEACGLLCHMTSNCRITSYFDSQGNIRDFERIRLNIQNFLASSGVIPPQLYVDKRGTPTYIKKEKCSTSEVLSILLDGCVVGSVPNSGVKNVVAKLRRFKVSSTSEIPDDLEVGYVPLSFGGAYPGLYLFTSPGRFVRPVRNISIHREKSQNIELIGPFEQVFMEICCPDGKDGGRKNASPATHQEIGPTGMLSVVANLIPWSDHNHSKRNMVQCQMAKQAMGFSQAIRFCTDKKLYRLQTPQTPLVRTSAYTRYHMDEHPTGTNAVVAVVSYTGYDMLDAIVLNKSSVERGMFRGEIYKTETIDLPSQRFNGEKSKHFLSDLDGLPYVGQMVQPGDPYCYVKEKPKSSSTTCKLKGSNPAIVDFVEINGEDKKADIRFRHPRNPEIGDKFSSRHGQKGVCSYLFPDVDMPYSGVTGMRPDLIINPHAFPSRMTIGMLLECIAAKGCCLNGSFVDGTPFRSKSSSLLEEVGEMLKKCGFNSLGSEVLYSGIYGTEIPCDIFVGMVYYERLRQMVSEHSQVRSTGMLDQTTLQPIKGGKYGGGIRFGEMEKDSLLAHGASFLLHDRLQTCSDCHIAYVCSVCKSILTTSFLQQPQLAGLPFVRASRKATCHVCQTSRGMEKVAMPYVLRYLAAELAAMNIKMTFELNNEFKYLATASSDHTVNIWNVDGFTLEETLIARCSSRHQRWVWECVFSVDGAYLITASADTNSADFGTCHLAKKSRCIRDMIKQLVFSPS